MDYLLSLGPLGGAVVLSGVELVADFGAKTQNYVLAVGGYNVLALVWTAILRNNPLGLTNLYWNAFTNWGNIAVGAALGERLSGTQYVGAALITTGILLLGQ